MTVRPLKNNELPQFLELFLQLADDDGTGRENVLATEADLTEAIFGDTPVLRVLVSEAAGEIAGIASWCERFAARTGRKAMWLSDLYVASWARRQGHGRALLQALSEICVDNDYCRIEWKVAPNSDAAELFYTSNGAAKSDMALWELSDEEMIRRRAAKLTE